MARRKQQPQATSEAQTALDDLAAVFWRAALAEVEKELNEETSTTPQTEERETTQSVRST